MSGKVNALARYAKALKLCRPIPTAYAHAIITMYVYNHWPQINATFALTPGPQPLQVNKHPGM